MAVEKWNDDAFAANMPSAQLVVIDFGAPWCGPCQKLHPIVAELSEEYAGKVRFVEMDVAESTLTAQQYNVFSVPQLIFFRSGERLATINGFQAKSKIAEQIDRSLNC